VVALAAKVLINAVLGQVDLDTKELFGSGTRVGIKNLNVKGNPAEEQQADEKSSKAIAAGIKINLSSVSLSSPSPLVIPLRTARDRACSNPPANASIPTKEATMQIIREITAR
jgi:hypothetical protein